MSTLLVAPQTPLINLSDGFNGTPDYPQITVLNDGNSVLTWTARGGRPGEAEVWARVSAPDGTPIGAAFLVNTTTDFSQSEPDVLALPDGGFVIVWQSFGQDHFFYESGPTQGRDWSQQFGVYQQVYDADANPVGGETLVNEGHIFGAQVWPELTPLADGGYVVTWVHNNTITEEEHRYTLYSRVYDSSGDPVGDPFRNPGSAPFETNAGTAYEPPYYNTVASSLPNGNLVYSWYAVHSADIFITITDLDGALVNQFKLTESLDVSPNYIQSVLGLPNGNIMIAWYDDNFISDSLAVAIVDETGEHVVPVTFAVPFDQEIRWDLSGVELNLLPDGNVLVSWIDINDGILRGRIISPDGTHLTDIINLTPEGVIPNGYEIGVEDGRIAIYSELNLLQNDILTADSFVQYFTVGLVPDDIEGTSREDLIEIEGSDGLARSGPRDDTVIGGEGSDLVMGGSGADSLVGHTGDDRLIGGSGADTLLGGAGRDVLVGGTAPDSLVGGDADDYLEGGAGHDMLRGGAGDDYLFGGIGSDTLFGDAGNDFLLDASHIRFGPPLDPSFLYGGEGDDTLESIVSGGLLDGGPGNDILQNLTDAQFGAGSTVRAGEGDDLVFTNQRTNPIDGGDGYDILFFDVDVVVDSNRVYVDMEAETFYDGNFLRENVVASPVGSVTGFEEVVFGNGPIHLAYGGFETDDIVSYDSRSYGSDILFFTNVILDARGGDDYIYDRFQEFNEADQGLYEAGFATIHGGDGNDTIRSGNAFSEIHGGDGDDFITARVAVDLLYGDAGNDHLESGGSDDTLFGGTGNDTLRGNEDQDRLEGGEGDDLIAGNTGDDMMLGQDGDDALFGGNGRDRATGGNGDDDIQGGADQDTLYGNNGRDTLNGNDGNDWLSGGNDRDLLLGRTGNDSLRGGNDDDRIYAGVGNDVVAGNSGNDQLFGGSGNDRIFGGRGNDTLTGGLGQDWLVGGQGADVFVFTAVDQSPHGADRDIIVDFTAGVDLIDLSGIAPSLTFVSSFSGVAGEVRYNESVGRLYVDTTGSGASNLSIDIETATALTAGDLIL
ncbi:calcium-binding protein [uncultured Pelagimonas sp.]|uniref:calcium-binding protein n=1 Tax=uncultured Pelagimonas sp. TaxID=1618102 RepID=UPI0026260869|nr:calcium-binding protein [uncultured Pelagimonas sp.]